MEISIFELPGLANCTSRLCGPLGSPPHPPQHPNRVKNPQRGHSSFSVHWPMYRGRGAGRWAESRSDARVLPYRPPACARTVARRDEAVMTKSLPSLPSRAAAAAVLLPSRLGYPASRRTRPSKGGLLAAPRRFVPPPWAGHRPRPCSAPLYRAWGE